MQSFFEILCGTWKKIKWMNWLKNWTLKVLIISTVVVLKWKNFKIFFVSKPNWTKYFNNPTRGRFLIRNFRRFAVSPNFFATNSCEKVGRRRTAQLDRAISMKFSLSSTFKKSTPGCHYCVIACVTGAFA